MKASELVAGTTYVTSDGTEHVYLGPWQDSITSWRSGYRRVRQPKASDLLTLRFLAGYTAGRPSRGEHPVKGGLWREETVSVASLQQPLSEMQAKREHDMAVLARYQEAAHELAAKLRKRGIKVGRLDRRFGEGYDKIEVPSAPLREGDYTGKARFSLKGIAVHLDAEDITKLMGE
jgi:hypothetical protein